jgi:hypothetical protein
MNNIRYTVVLALAAFIVSGSAHTQEAAPERNGAWLRNGIELYQRMNRHEELPQNETGRALFVASYVCAVVDLEKYLVYRSDLLKRAVTAAQKHTPMDPKELKGIYEGLPLSVPLMETRFLQDSPSCETVLGMVQSFLFQNPELLPMGAEVVVEGALLEAYSESAS